MFSEKNMASSAPSEIGGLAAVSEDIPLQSQNCKCFRKTKPIWLSTLIYLALSIRLH